MTKKKKGTSVPASSRAVQQGVSPKPAVENAVLKSHPVAVQPSPDEKGVLIRFDRRLKLFIGICVGVFLLLTLAKIHTVSIPAWNQILPDGTDLRRGLISGEPRRIRMDDYAVGTPWILSQANKGFPVENETIGGLKAPVLVTPSKHFSEIFKPDHWGFFLLDVERGYAWMYNFRLMFALIGATLMLLLLTRNNFWLSVFGSVWLLLSSGTVSWMFIPTPMIAAMGILFVATVYFLYGQTARSTLISSAILAWALMNYVLILYPPYEVPLGYVILALLGGYLINNFDSKRLLANWPVKAGSAAVALGLLGASFYLFYSDVKPTLDAIMNTAYPGKRSELGGTGFVANWFSEFFSWQYTDQKFPASWLNHCEISHYLTFAPVIIPLAIATFVATRKIDWTIALLIAFVLFGYVWIEIGFPEWLAKATLMSMSPTRRTQIPFGIGNVLLTVLYLHYLTTVTVKQSTAYTLLGIAGVLAFLIYTGNVNVADSERFFTWGNILLPVLFFAALGSLLIPTWTPPFRNAIFGTGIVLFLLPNLKLNPVSKGLTPITEHVLYRTVKDIARAEPNARWMVNGSQYISYMITATGVNLLSGVKYIPERKIMKVLDPQAKRDTVYNRYAHTVYASYIDGRDSVVMFNQFFDGYTVALDPCSPRLKQLNVKYVVFDKQPQPVEVRCMKQVTTLGNIQIYRVND